MATWKQNSLTFPRLWKKTVFPWLFLDRGNPDKITQQSNTLVPWKCTGIGLIYYPQLSLQREPDEPWGWNCSNDHERSIILIIEIENILGNKRGEISCETSYVGELWRSSPKRNHNGKDGKGILRWTEKFVQKIKGAWKCLCCSSFLRFHFIPSSLS